MSFFGAAHGWRGVCKKAPPLPKMLDRYHTMMELGRVISYLKKTHVTHSLSCANINIFSSEISKFCYTENTDIDCNFGTAFLFLLTFF